MYLNQSGKDFLNAGFLLGSAFEYDSRSVIAADLDENGTQDIIVIEYDPNTKSQRLHIYKNTIVTKNSWIGVKLTASKGNSLIGSTVTAKSKTKSWSKLIVTGDGFTSQGPSTAHFGLGKINKITEIEVNWPSGEVSKLENPKLNTYHRITTEKLQ